MSIVSLLQITSFASSSPVPHLHPLFSHRSSFPLWTTASPASRAASTARSPPCTSTPHSPSPSPPSPAAPPPPAASAPSVPSSHGTSCSSGSSRPAPPARVCTPPSYRAPAPRPPSTPHSTLLPSRSTDSPGSRLPCTPRERSGLIVISNSNTHSAPRRSSRASASRECAGRSTDGCPADAHSHPHALRNR